MSSATLTEGSILVRSLGVSTRAVKQVAGRFEDTDGGALLETMLGRYVLNRDGLAVWFLLDGRRSVSQVADALADERGFSATGLRQSLRDFCVRLTELGLAEFARDGAQ